MERKNSSAETGITDRILELLAGGEWVSGEELAEKFGVSRAAVAKHIAKLKRDGNTIRSRTHRGYRLEVPVERLSRATVLPLLRTRILGRAEWREFESTASTNTEAISLALDGGAIGSVVTAHRQTHGKGRRGHSWFSSPHGMHISLLLPPLSKAADYARINSAALHAVSQAVKSMTGLQPVVKPPNDLLVNGKKICGVLVESGQRGGEADWVVVGIGCNVNVVPDEFPPEISGRVTSAYAESGVVLSKNRLAAETLNNLETLLDLKPAPKRA